MTRSGSKRSSSLAPDRIVKAAVEAYLDGTQPRRDERPARKDSRRKSGATLALGVAIGVGARAVYRRARDVDLTQVARAVERRMVN